MEKTKAKLITLEGIEGCGKTTQQRRLVDLFESKGLRCHKTKEPGGTQIGQLIRKILLHPEHVRMVPACEALLYLADRAQHHSEVIRPALARGEWVICDRYHDSTLAYQGAARGLERSDLDAMFRLATGNLKPDLTILLDLDPDKGVSRARARNRHEQLTHTVGRFEAEKLHFHQEVRQCFLDLAAAEPDRFEVVKADQSTQNVARAIREIVERRWVGALV